MGDDNKTIVFISQIPWTDQDLLRYGITDLNDKGIRTVVVDVRALLIDEVKSNAQPFTTHSLCTSVTIHDWTQFNEVAAGFNSAALIVCMFSNGDILGKQHSLLRILSKNVAPYLIFKNVLQPGLANIPESIISKLNRKIAKLLNTTELKQFSMARLPLFILGIRPVDFVVYGGDSSMTDAKLISNKSVLISAHSWDYEQATRVTERLGSTTQEEVKKKYAVFLDQHLPFHYDWVQFGGHQIDEKKYYQKLRDYFTKIRQDTGLDVIISLHPKSNYDDKPWCFEGFLCQIGSTAELVYKSSLVLAHHSTAISFAAVYEKPLYILKCADVLASSVTIASMIASYQTELGAKSIDLDQVASQSLADWDEFDKDKYRRYVLKYMKGTNSKGNSIWDEILSVL